MLLSLGFCRLLCPSLCNNAEALYSMALQVGFLFFPGLVPSPKGLSSCCFSFDHSNPTPLAYGKRAPSFRVCCPFLPSFSPGILTRSRHSSHSAHCKEPFCLLSPPFVSSDLCPLHFADLAQLLLAALSLPLSLCFPSERHRSKRQARVHTIASAPHHCPFRISLVRHSSVPLTCRAPNTRTHASPLSRIGAAPALATHTHKSIIFSFRTLLSNRHAHRFASMGAICVHCFDDSLTFAIHITYRILLRASSLTEPRYPLLRVV